MTFLLCTDGASQSAAVVLPKLLHGLLTPCTDGLRPGQHADSQDPGTQGKPRVGACLVSYGSTVPRMAFLMMGLGHGLTDRVGTEATLSGQVGGLLDNPCSRLG